MYCPKCLKEEKKIKTEIIDSRLGLNQTVRRRHQCKECNYRFTTWESTINMESREHISKLLKMRLNKIKKQAQEIIDIIEKKK